MAQNYNPNSFKQQQAAGGIDLSATPNGSVFTARYSPESAAGDILPGEGVLLVDLGGTDFNGPPIVDKRTVNTTDPIWGTIIRQKKSQTQSPGDAVEVATLGAVGTFEASAAIARDGQVELILGASNEAIVAPLTTGVALGYSLDKATQAGELIRIKITAAGV